MQIHIHGSQYFYFSISAIEGLASGLYLIVSATSMGPRYIVRQDNIFGVAALDIKLSKEEMEFLLYMTGHI